MRFTKTIATIGPSTSDPQNLEKLYSMGVHVARLNFSHGSHDSHRAVIQELQKLNKKYDNRLAIMLDTKGPEIRSGDVTEKIKVERGEEVIFTHKPLKNEKLKVIQVGYSGFIKDVKKSPVIIIDNGAMEFTVKKVVGNNVHAVALDAGLIGSRRHINLPGAYISLPSFTDKDWSDIDFGIEHDVDFIATSFIREASDIRELRAYLKKNKSGMEIIAKIETKQAVEDIDNIIKESDGIMIARGDLGAEIPFEDVPRIQDEIVMKCRRRGRTVIVATHMLESMIQLPTPTRAEVTDIAHAVITQADSTMLSGETASGMYPFKSIEAMDRVIRANENVDTLETMIQLKKEMTDMRTETRFEQGLAASMMARNLKADAIVVFTRRGLTARAVSYWRPLVPILAFTPSESAQRRLRLSWGVDSFRVQFSDNPDKTVERAMDVLKDMKRLKKGQRVIIVSDILTTSKTPAMTIQVWNID